MSCRCLSKGADFTFFWKIKYFTLMNDLKKKNIYSETFNADNLYGTQWVMYLRRNQKNQSFDLILKRGSEDDGPLRITIDFSLKVLNKAIPSKTLNDDIISDSSILSSDNLLNIQCSFKDPANKVHQVCKSITEMDVERVSFIWNTFTSTDDLGKVSINPVNINNQAPPLKISVYSEMNEGGKTLRFSVNGKKVLEIEANFIVVCKITLLSNFRNTGPSIESLHVFNSACDVIWYVPQFFKVDDVKAEFSNSLTFLFDLKFSYGLLSSKIGEIIDINIPSNDVSSLQSEDFLHMYKNGHFYNVTLRVGDRTFPAHKDILCMRSPVFESIILEDEEAKEILITDLDSETLDIFLTFLYSNMSLELMNSRFCALVGDEWKKFKKLYTASDRYEVSKLKYTCSLFIAQNINSENVIECMKLAELYQDDYLKVETHNYFSNYASEIITSDAFKELLKE